MKKLSLYVFLVLLFCIQALAEELILNCVDLEDKTQQTTLIFNLEEKKLISKNHIKMPKGLEPPLEVSDTSIAWVENQKMGEKASVFFAHILNRISGRLNVKSYMLKPKEHNKLMDDFDDKLSKKENEGIVVELMRLLALKEFLLGFDYDCKKGSQQF